MKLLIGGSPCTHWSIARTKNRETEPEGIGWELFKNYLIALEKFKPDFFLYENNKSMAPAIREQITRELGVEPILINSALVSAQNRQRLYWTNIPGVEQPEDLGILLRDILESGLPLKEKGYTLKANYANAGAVNGVCGQHFPAPMAAEPVRIGTIESDAKNADFDSQQYRVYSPDGKSVTLCGQGGGVGAKTGLYATPVRVGDMPNASGEVSGSQSGRIYSVDGKGVPLQAGPNGGGADGAATGLYAVPAGMAWRGRGESSSYEMRDDQKANSVTAAGHQSRLVVEPVAGRIVGRRINADGHRDDYNESIERFQRFEANDNPQKTNCITTVTKDNMVAVPAECYGLPIQLEITAEDGKTYPVYEVRDGQITIKGKQYPTKLANGLYIIRKLTVLECKRLQTVPDSYIFPVSNTQAYKMLGNGWTVDVIAHILHYVPGITEEPLEVLSMYDGMSCGHLALDKLGAHVARYYATEIDKYAIKTTQHNFPDTIQLGDAFQVRDDRWEYNLERVGVPVDYTDFIKAKSTSAIHADSIRVDTDQLNPALYPFQRDIVRWALAKGRAAVFADCGLGKTAMQLEWAKVVCLEQGGSVLILAPLAVSTQTVSEGFKFGVPVTLCESAADVRPGINITNYEKLGKFEGCIFSGVVLDESSILKSFTGKVRNQIIDFFCHTPFRLACTATPAPNDFMELGNHAEFLGIMSYSEMLAMFFVHDGGQTSKWRLKGHAQDVFWHWMGSWAVVLDSPATLGYSADGYDLPDLRVHQIVADGAEPVTEALSLTQRRQARKDTLLLRCEAAAELVNGSDEQWLVWCDLNTESEELSRLISGAVEVKGSDKPEHRSRAMLGFSMGLEKCLITKPSIAGFGMNWQQCHNMIFVGLSDSYEQYYQAVRRCWRFGQALPVNIYIIISSREGCVKENIERKQRDCEQMHTAMVEQTKNITREELRSTCRLATPYIPAASLSLPGWKEFSA